MSDLTQDFIEQIKSGVDKKQQIIIKGNGTKNFLGRDVTSDKASGAHTISCSGHRGIISYEPVELVMTVRAGTTLQEIDDALTEHKQVLACDPARFDGRATFGGSLAANISGPGRPWLGSIRDHVLGVSLINGRGEHLRFGGQVMKNVAGYDVSRLQAGAMGTLGLMTEISFKVLPKPAATMTLCAEATQTDAIRIMNELSGQAKPMTAACWMNNSLYIRLSGAKSAVEGTVSQWQRQLTNTKALSESGAQVFWSGLRDLCADFFNSQSSYEPLWRFSLNSAAPVCFDSHPWLLNWAGSERWLKGSFDPQELSIWAAEQGGEVVQYRGGDRSQEIIVKPSAVMQTIRKNIKQSFDPHNIFNVGRLYSWM